MELSWLLGLVHEKHRDALLDEALEEFYEMLSADHKHQFKKMLKGVAFYIDHKEAVEIVKRMTPHGEHWSTEQIEKVIAERGVPHDELIHYYLVMNMAYNDYKRTAENFGIDNVDFYFHIAHDFIDDPDAKDFKVEKYFM